MAPQCWQEGFGFTTIAQAFAPESPVQYLSDRGESQSPGAVACMTP